MKKLAFALSAVVILVLIGNVTGTTPEVTRVTEKLFHRIVVYAHMARLYTREPDKTISMPVSEVLKAQVANSWGAARGSDRLHQGQDIFAPRGTPVLSATEGYVLRIGENSLGGQTVSVVGAGGRVYYYAHLESYAPRLAEGDFVTTNSVLGYVGTTGNAAGTSPHLHFGVYERGGAVNPLPLLIDRPSENKTKQIEALNTGKKPKTRRAGAN